MPIIKTICVDIIEGQTGFHWEMFSDGVTMYKDRSLKSKELCKENCRKFLLKYFPNYEPEFNSWV